MRTESQLNVRVPATFKAKVKRDAAKFGKTSEIVVTAILKEFFGSFNETERESFYRAEPQPYKRFGASTKPIRKAA